MLPGLLITVGLCLAFIVKPQVLVLLLPAILLYRILRRRIRKALLLRQGRRIRDDWIELLRDESAVYAGLSPQQQTSLHALVVNFIQRIEFIGRESLHVTDQMRVLVAAQAGVLMLGRLESWYPKVKRVYLYPALIAEVPEGKDSLPNPRAETVGVMGPEFVGFSWPSVLSSARGQTGCLNVVYHEFAHQLDLSALEGYFDGSPLGPWDSARAHRRFNAALREAKTSRGDAYRDKDHDEFFAYMVEEFFLTPQTLFEKHPALFDSLLRFFKQDPRVQAARS